MFWRTSSEENEMILQTPQDYIFELEQYRKNEEFKGEVREIGEQIRTFEKRANDVHLISFREFEIDDHLLMANQIVESMKKKLYHNIEKILFYLSTEEEHPEKQIAVRKRICNTDMILADLTSLLSYILKVEESEQSDSLSEIEDVLVNMEDIYINELTKE